jgi:O-antigen/teichoic acid export membrane protein
MAMGSNILTGFILFPLIIKYLGLDTLGIFGIFYSIKSIVDIGIGWLSGSITKNLIKYKYLKSNIATVSFITNWSYGLFGAIVFICYGYFIKPEYFMSAVYFSIFIFVSFAWLPYAELLISELKQYQVAFFRFLSQFFFMLGSIGAILFVEHKSLDIIFMVLSISNIFLLILILLYYHSNYTIKLKINKINKKMLHKLFITDGSRFFINGISTILLLQIDVLLIDYLYGSVSAGIYLIIWKVPNTLIMLGWRLSEPFQAIVSKNIKSDIKNIKLQFFVLEKKILLASIIVSILYFFSGSIILNIWIGKDNIPNIDYMYFIPAIVIIFSVMQRLYLSVNYYTTGLNTVSILQFIEITFKIIFIIFFFDDFHELAPVIGWLIAFLFTIWFHRKNSLKVIIGAM